jgi:hypothetical protein
MITAVISVLIMMQFAVPVGNFVITLRYKFFIILIWFHAYHREPIYQMHLYLAVMLLQFPKVICYILLF